MNGPSLEARVAQLEQRYAELLQLIQSQPTPGGWQSVIGILSNDPGVEEHLREVQQIREDDRAAARREGAA